MTEDWEPFLLANYIEQEIRDYFDDDEDLPSEETIKRTTITITKYVDQIILNQINNAFF